MLKKILKEIGRFILVVLLLVLYIILCSWLEKFGFIEKFVSKINFKAYLLLISILPFSTALHLWKKSKAWLVDLILIILAIFALHFIAEKMVQNQYTKRRVRNVERCVTNADCPQVDCIDCGVICKSGKCVEVHCKTHGKFENFKCICDEGWTGRYCEKEIVK